MLKEATVAEPIKARQGRMPLFHCFQPPLRVVKQLLEGKSLIRALFNLSLERHTVGGRILDLGSKSGTGTYYRHLKMEPGSECVFTDIEDTPGVVKLDVEKPFPLPDAGFDTV